MLNTSNFYDFLPFFDLQDIFTSSDPQQYKFPVTTLQIDSIVDIHKPNDIDIIEIKPKENFFHLFIQQVNEWLRWYDKFIDIFQYIIEWLKTCKVEGADQFLSEIYTIRDNPSTTIIQIKTIIQQILNVLKPFNNLRRLCDLFNCLNSFENIDCGTLSVPDQWKSYIAELKRLHSLNKFIVDVKTQYEHGFPIDDRRHVYWSLVCEKLECNVKIEYRMNGSHNQNYELFDGQKLPLNKQILKGEFKTQRGGHLVIIIGNSTGLAPRVIRYQIISTALSTCHLFHGIFNRYYQEYLDRSIQTVKDTDMSRMTDKTLLFIDNLLNSNITLKDMDYLKTVFHDKNINVREEVKKLFANRSIVNNNTAIARPTTTTITTLNIPNDQEIEQVCERLRTYQYYSHLNIIIDCVQKFNIVPNSGENDKSIDHLQKMTINENCSLKEISETYKDLYERFRKLSNHHLQLIKIVERSNVVQMMKASDLYSTNGLRRFQELRDNLTTQFQLQDRNNMILNSWIISYALCEPFVRQVENLEGFVDNLSRLSNINESSLEHIKSKLNISLVLKIILSLILHNQSLSKKEDRRQK